MVVPLILACLINQPSDAAPERSEPARDRNTFDQWDRNGDGKLSRDELPPLIRKNFDRADANNDGFISRAEDREFRNRGRQSQRGLPQGAKLHRDLEYVPDGHERQKLDLFLPPPNDSATTIPLIVWIHGGAWRAGSKQNCPAVPFVGRGYAVASINYRLSRHAIYPAQINDCKSAIRWLRASAKKYGINPNRIGVWGSSAGGHLVALLGTSGDVEELERDGADLTISSRVQAVCDYFGPTDFLQMNRQAGDQGRIDHDAPNSPESLLIGGPIHDHPDKAARANPITWVSDDDPPFLIVHGDQDFTVPLGQSRLLHEALQKAGVTSTLQIVPGAGHGRFRDPEVGRAVESFFDRQLKDTKP